MWSENTAATFSSAAVAPSDATNKTARLNRRFFMGCSFMKFSQTTPPPPDYFFPFAVG
jgi:hypothetical protein